MFLFPRARSPVQVITIRVEIALESSTPSHVRLSVEQPAAPVVSKSEPVLRLAPAAGTAALPVHSLTVSPKLHRARLTEAARRFSGAAWRTAGILQSRLLRTLPERLVHIASKFPGVFIQFAGFLW